MVLQQATPWTQPCSGGEHGAGVRMDIVRQRHGMHNRGRLGVNEGSRVDILSA